MVSRAPPIRETLLLAVAFVFSSEVVATTSHFAESHARQLELNHREDPGVLPFHAVPESGPGEEADLDLDLGEIAVLPRRAKLQLRAWPLPSRKPVMWVHIHKSAGSTMCHFAEEMGEAVVQPNRNCNYVSERRWSDGFNWRAVTKHARLQWTTCAQRRSFFAKHGFTWGAIEREISIGDLCVDDFAYAGIFRDPMDRLESLINYFPYKAHGVGWTEQVACIRRKRCPYGTEWEQFDNYVVRSLGGYEAMRLPPGDVTEEHLAGALRILEKFDLALPLENITGPDAAAEMDRVLGWHLEAQGRHVNAFKHEVLFSGELESLRELRDINKYDIKLYRHVVAQRR